MLSETLEWHELKWKIGTEHRTVVRSTVNRNPVRFIYLFAIAHGKRSKKGWRAFEGTSTGQAYLFR